MICRAHRGVVRLYRAIADQGYTLLYLTNRAIGQAGMTREYLAGLQEAGVSMPAGPVLCQVDSLLGAIQTEVLPAGQPEVNKGQTWPGMTERREGL